MPSTDRVTMTINTADLATPVLTAHLPYCERCADRHDPAGDCDADRAEQVGMTLFDYRTRYLTLDSVRLPDIVEITREGRRVVENWRHTVVGATPVLAAVKVEPDPDPMFPHYTVTPVWANVDRPTPGSTAVRDRKTANRLAAAIFAGVTDVPVAVRVDCYGHTYVETRSEVRGRALNADLRKLGY